LDSVIVNTLHGSVKNENWNMFGVVHMLQNFKKPLKIKERVLKNLISEVLTKGFGLVSLPGIYNLVRQSL
jgi:hypothetical protein